MVEKLNEWPSKGELVIAKIKKIKSYGCFAELLEYEKEGMIHISEISSKWVRNIRKFVKPDQRVILKVVKVNPNKNRIDLSLKRVSDKEKGDKIEEWKKEKRAEKLLEIAAEKLNKDLEEAYKEAGYLMIEEYYTLYDAFEETVLRGKEALEEANIPDEWIKVLVELAQKEITIPDKEIKGTLKITTYKPEGIDLIRDALSKVKKNVDITYISAPKYRIIASAKRYKKAEEKLERALEKIKSSLGEEATFSFNRQ